MHEATVVRASSLTGYGDCARRAAATIFREEIEAAGFVLRHTPRGIGATCGTAVHAGAAYTLNEKLAGGNLAPLSAVTDCVVESYRQEAAEGVLFDQVTPSGRDAERQVISMVSAYQRVIAPQIEPLIIETRLEADTGLGLILSGQKDVLAREPSKLRDLKSGKRQGAHAPQIGAYGLLSRSHGLEVTEACIDFVPRVSVKKPQPDPVSIPYNVAHAETAAISVLRHIAGDIKTFREGKPEMRIQPGDPWAFLSNPASMLCSATWCQAHSTDFCDEWRAKDA